MANLYEKGSNSPISSKANNMSKIYTVDETDELTIEERMATLPHWKYRASFDSYMSSATTVLPDLMEEFMKV